MLDYCRLFEKALNCLKYSEHFSTKEQINRSTLGLLNIMIGQLITHRRLMYIAIVCPSVNPPRFVDNSLNLHVRFYPSVRSGLIYANCIISSVFVSYPSSRSAWLFKQVCASDIYDTLTHYFRPTAPDLILLVLMR